MPPCAASQNSFRYFFDGQSWPTIRLAIERFAEDKKRPIGADFVVELLQLTGREMLAGDFERSGECANMYSVTTPILAFKNEGIFFFSQMN